jgi:hypothetical protein
MSLLSLNGLHLVDCLWLTVYLDVRHPPSRQFPFPPTITDGLVIPRVPRRILTLFLVRLSYIAIYAKKWI